MIPEILKESDEKNLALMCLTILGLAALLTFSVDALSVVVPIVTGISGMITGTALERAKK